MKNKLINRTLLSASLLAMIAATSSCVGDLDVEPIDPTTVMVVDADALFNKCFANMAMESNEGQGGSCDIDGIDGGTSGFFRQLWNSNELTTDESLCGWGDEGIPAFDYNAYDASHPMLKGLYYRLYLGVSLCNHYLETCSGYNPTYTAEIRFLRTLYYYYLLDNYGNVPFTLEVSDEAAPQYSRAELYNWIENEVLDVVEDMNDQTPVYGRPDKVAAWMLLARLYLNAEVYTGTANWSKAAEYAEKVINSHYSLFTVGNGTYSAYQMLFMGDNGENGAACEAIFPILQDGLKTTNWGGMEFLIAASTSGDMGDFGTTEQWAGNTVRSDLAYVLVGEGKTNSIVFGDVNDESTTNQYKMAELAGDDRALLTAAGKKSVEIGTNTNDFAYGLGACKYTNIYSTGEDSHHTQFVDGDIFLMRVAEAYLTYAEAKFRSGDSSSALEKINALRSRANASTYTTISEDQILDEWQREFWWEARRRVDLIRFGYFGGSNTHYWEWKGGSQNGTTFSSDKNIFAIPDADMNVNSNLVQNPGY